MKSRYSAPLLLLSVAAFSQEANSAPLWTFTPLTETTVPVSPNSIATIQYTVTNQSKKHKHTLLMVPIVGITETTTCGNPMALPPQASCTLTLQVMGNKLTGNVVDGPYLYQQGTDCGATSLQCYRPKKEDLLNITLSAVPEAILTVNPLTLALSVNDTTTNAALTGNPRQITITNSSTTVTAYDVTYSAQNLSPANPNITSNAMLDSSCDNIPPLGTCILTITPVGATASATPYNTSPTPIVLTITGSNTNTLSYPINILTYGSVYEQGYVYAINDSYANYPENVSVGGTVVELQNRIQSNSPGITWSSSGDNANIWGIDNQSTFLNPSPNSPQATYIPPQNNCYGATDGYCDTNNIYIYYTITQSFLIGTYAAGVCKQISAGYADWYLPSICEMGPNAGNTICSTIIIEQNMVDSLPALLQSPPPPQTQYV